MRVRRSLFITVVSLLAVLVAMSALADEAVSSGTPPTPEDVAAAYAAAFLESRFGDLDPLSRPELKAALTPEKGAEILAAMTARYGAFRSVAEPWHEDDVQGYARYRVPVTFENGELDLRIVLDSAGMVAGFFQTDHVPRPDPSNAPKAPVAEEEVSFGPEGRQLPGTLSIPDGAGPFPGIVLVHGSGPNDRDETVGQNKPFRDIAWGLADRGVAVLRYDKRTKARPQDFAEVADRFTVQHEVIDDAWAAMDFLRADERIADGKVFLLGHSLGGTLAPSISAREPRPAGMVILAGATLPLPELMLGQTKYLAMLDGTVSDQEGAAIANLEAMVTALRAALDGEAEPPSTATLGAPFAYFEHLDALDPPAEAKALKLPALILQGKRDYQVTRADFDGWKAALDDAPFACLHAYFGLDHLFRPGGTGAPSPKDYERAVPVSDEVIADIAAWVLEGACPAAANE